MPILRPGDRLKGRYTVRSVIGQGAMSRVYLVEDRHLSGALWAVKELVEHSLPEGDRAMARQLFCREGEILASLNHPGLPAVIDQFSELPDRHYLVMEFIEGTPLDEILLRRSLPLKPVEAVPIALQATHVLECLQRQDPPIVYRDVKPSNLILTPSGKVRFIDFGIARYYRAEASKDTQELGTPGFSAPEQYGRAQSTPQSDIYSLGVTLFQMLTLEDPQPFQFRFPPLANYQPVPPVLQRAVERCLQLDPADRYPSAAALRVDLEEALRQAEPSPGSSTRPLSPPLLRLARHVYLVRESRRTALWRFWKNWAVRTFNLEPAPRR